jgi:hypothetical protein
MSFPFSAPLTSQKKVHEVLENNHEFVDLKLLDWHMVEFQETPLITSGGSLGLGGAMAPSQSSKISLANYYFSFFFLSMLFEYD